ncbi:MAG: glycoside hydrolase family 130 protein [Cyclobacteriaceae bacterium]
MRSIILLFALAPFLMFCSTEIKEKRKSLQLNGFVKVDSINPFMSPETSSWFECPVTGSSTRWESRNVLNPAAVVFNDKIHLLYRAQDSAMTSRIGLAVSNDGLHFDRLPEPVFYPEEGLYDSLEWPGGVEDPRIVMNDEGKFILTYTAYDGKTARLCLATSDDLRVWQRHGPVLQDSAYANLWTKSGAIVSRREGSRIIATRINGKYWMYFGDTDLFMASSEDGLNWVPLLNEENGELIRVLHPRPGYFDSRLVEPGPYALLTSDGIVLIYNASNAQSFSDPDLPRFTYAAGQALFDPQYPWKIKDRSGTYFIHPEKSYEISGEVDQVCFVEGLVFFRGKWFMYYGTADSRIAVAVSSED